MTKWDEVALQSFRNKFYLYLQMVIQEIGWMFPKDPCAAAHRIINISKDDKYTLSSKQNIMTTATDGLNTVLH
jgi:hypothetical protein